MPEVTNTDGISISLRGFDDSIREAYETLFPGDPEKSQDLLEWRFRRNPHGETKFAVASKDEQIVGLIALVPTQIRSSSGDVLGYQAIDTAVHPSCRGRGLFVRMGELAQNPDRLGGEILCSCFRPGSRLRAAMSLPQICASRRSPSAANPKLTTATVERAGAI